MANEFMGWQKYLVLRKETTAGTYDSGGTDIYCPYSEYSVQAVAVSQQAELTLGVRQRRHSRRRNATLTGNLALPLMGQHVNSKSLAQHLLEWAFSAPSSPFLDSWTAQQNNPNGDKRHLGLRVSSATISGDATSNTVSLSMALMGQEEQEQTCPALSATAAQPIDANFSDVKFWVSSESQGESASTASEEVKIRNFSITLNNNLKVYHENGYWPTVVGAGMRTVDLAFGVFNRSNFYDGLRRSSTETTRVGHLQIPIPHLGSGASGTNTVINIYFDRLVFANATDQSSLNELDQQSTQWPVLKPSTSEDEIEIAYALA